MSDSMGSEFSPQQRQEVPTDNFLAAGDIVISHAVNKLPGVKGRQVKSNVSRWRMALAGVAVPFIVSCGWGDQQYFPPTPEPAPVSTTLVPAQTSTETPTQTPSTEISTSSETQEIPTHLESKVIDEMETYGDESPITQEQLSKLYEKLNSVQLEMRNNMYYGTIFISEKNYHEFQITKGKESFQNFLKRHEKVFNKMAYNQPYGNTNNLLLRRLVVVEDTINPPPSSKLNNVIIDSDGGWNFLGDAYIPEKAGYYNKDQGIDYGLLHELGHAIFHLPDQYSLSFNSDDALSDSIAESIPSQWRIYQSHERNDIGLDLMGSFMDNLGKGNIRQISGIGLHTNLQLLHRMQERYVHDSKKTVPEGYWNFPYDIPEKTTFVFGEDYKDADVDIFRSTEIDIDKRPSFYSRKKKLELIGNYVNSEEGNLTLPKDTLFPNPNNKNNLIKAEDSTLLLRMTKDGKNYFRWMDIRDFNIPYWLGDKEHVNMNLHLATEKDNPETFPWRITYSSGSPASP